MTTSQSRLTAILGALLTSVALTVSAADSPPLPAGLTAPLKRRSFLLSTANARGRTVRADDTHGKVVIARFWRPGETSASMRCPPLQRAYNEYQKSGVAVLAISIDGEGAQAVKAVP
jgi:hypothetical protein